MRIYICPALIDWLFFMVQFAVLYAAGERQLSALRCAWLAGILQLTYLSTSLVIGLVLNRRNARALLLGATVLGTATAATCLASTAFPVLMVELAAFGAFQAVFFNAFQTFMCGEAPPGGLARSVGLYTLSWSTGSSLGFLSSGLLYQLGPGALVTACLLVGGAVLGILLTYSPQPSSAPSAGDTIEAGAVGARPVNQAYVWVGWVMIFAGMFIQRPVHAFFPALCARQAVSPLLTSLPLFLQMLTQGLAGAALIRYPGLLYRRLPLVVFQATAAGLFLAMWAAPSFAVSFAGIAVMGVCTGFVYFSAVYYASNSLRRSLSIGVNECLVGVGSFVSLFVSEWWMKHTGHDTVLYLVCGVALVMALVPQLLVATVRRLPSRAAATRGA